MAKSVAGNTHFLVITTFINDNETYVYEKQPKGGRNANI